MMPGSACTPSRNPYRNGTVASTGIVIHPSMPPSTPVATPIAAQTRRMRVERAGVLTTRAYGRPLGRRSDAASARGEPDVRQRRRRDALGVGVAGDRSEAL